MIESSRVAESTAARADSARGALLRVEHATKRFGSTLALDDVTIDIHAGRVHAILGENGAGKSTLLHLLFGMARPDAGRLLWKGAPIRLASPADSIRLGIGMVHQHFMLVPAFTVWENVLLVHPDRARALVRPDVAREVVRGVAARHGLALDPDARVEDLPVGARQRVEIAKALAREAEALILDEPTAVLTPGESRELMRLLGTLRDRGKAIVFVSHKLSEVLEVADEITVLRRGRVTGRYKQGEADAKTLAACVLGNEPAPSPLASARTAKDERGPVALELRDLSARFANGVNVEGISLEVRAGEIVGIGGVDGNGQSELAALLAGVARPDRGAIYLAGENVTAVGPRERWRKGLGLLPGDRGREGLVLDFAVWENLALRTFGEKSARGVGGLLVNPRVHRERADRLLGSFDVRGPGIDAPARALSGGNQQKLLLARELGRDPKALVVVNPTRGLDVGAAADVLRRLVELRDRGGAILLLSTELDDVLDIAGRAGVLVNGMWCEMKTRDRDAFGAAMLA